MFFSESSKLRNEFSRCFPINLLLSPTCHGGDGTPSQQRGITQRRCEPVEEDSKPSAGEELCLWTDKQTLPLTWKPGPAPSDFPATKCVTDAVLSLRGGTTSHSKRKVHGQFGFLPLLPLSSFPCFPPTLLTSHGKGQSHGETHWAEFPSDTTREGPGTL